MWDRRRLDMKPTQIVHKKLNSCAGFTFTELLVVLCLFALLSGFFLNCFVFAMEQYRNSIALMELEDNLCISMDCIASDLRETTAVLNCSTDSLNLQTVDCKVYYTRGTDTQAKEHFYDLTGKILYRRENTQINRQPMANFISDVCVNYYDELGNPTEQASNVKIVEILLEGTWNETVISKALAVRLNDSDYL